MSLQKELALIIRYLWSSRRKKPKKTFHAFSVDCIHTLHLDRYARGLMLDEVTKLKNDNRKVHKNEYLQLIIKLTNRGYAHSIDALRQVSTMST